MKSKNQTATIIKTKGQQDTLSKSKIRERIWNTCLNKRNEFAIITKWTTGDDSTLIHWKLYPTKIGEILIASSDKGVCFIGFGDEKRDMSFHELQKKFSKNKIEEGTDNFQKEALDRLANPEGKSKVHLHLKGTSFQIGVWERILQVPFGGLITYGKLGITKKDARAVGAAVVSNPVCLIVGCHRVVRADGNIEGFHYGTEIKEKLLEYEASHVNTEN
jgi:O-6-methylguanine DNA methyltransferase